MTRIKRGVMANKRRKNTLKRAKGFENRRSTHYRAAKEALLKAETNAYRDRKNRKRDFKSLWIVRINAALRENGTTWSKFAKVLKAEKISLNKKMLAELAVKTPKAFDQFVKELSK